jgi:hypothetical protein
MEGEVVVKHPNKPAIDEMFQNGHTAEEVQSYLKQIQKNKRWQTSKVTLQHYRKNFLNLTRLDVNRIRREMQAAGNNRDENVITTFQAGQEFSEAKRAKTEEIYNFINDFKSIKDKALSAISLIEATNRDADGNPTFRPRDFEIMEKFLGRIESTSNSYIKAVQEMNKSSSAGMNQTNITVTTAEIEKYKEAFKEIIKKIALELSPDKINRMITIYSEGISKITGISTGNFQIQINTTGNAENNINIITSSSLPTADQADRMAQDIVNENILENVIDIPTETDQNKEQI